MSASISLFSNIPEPEAPAAPLRQIYLLEKGNGRTAAELCMMKPCIKVHTAARVEF